MFPQKLRFAEKRPDDSAERVPDISRCYAFFVEKGLFEGEDADQPVYSAPDQRQPAFAGQFKALTRKQSDLLQRVELQKRRPSCLQAQ